ncbi:MAG: outer membrane beta-barrel protein [Pseudomonadota bacterium]|nr:outer membrane beta-barrel protein [Pseudomonadota bacterium]
MWVRAVFFSVALCALLGFANSVYAQSAGTTESHSGDYLSLLMIGSVSQIDDVSASSGTLQERNTDDTTAALGVALGYNWAKKGLPIRSEIEYHYRIRFDFDTRVLGTAGYQNQLSTHAVLVNAYYDHRLSETLAVFGGGGIGWAQNVSDVTRTNLAGTAATGTDRTDETDNFAWNLAVGSIWSFSKNWDLEFRYRYINLGEVSSGPHIDGATISADSYTAHDVIIGFSYRF